MERVRKRGDWEEKAEGEESGGRKKKRKDGERKKSES